MLMQTVGVKFRVSGVEHSFAAGIHLLQERWSSNLHNRIAIATSQPNRQVPSRSGLF
jgi:hypothetical protein